MPITDPHEALDSLARLRAATVRIAELQRRETRSPENSGCR